MTRIASMTAGFASVFLWLDGAHAAGLGDGGGYHHDGFMGYYGGGMMMGWMGPVMMIAVLVLIGVVVWALISAATGRGGHHGRGDDSALTVLRERYARGEIDHDEFEARRQRLT
ncbi:MAG: SHOCT domain-containing protein [Rhodospirillales bacterium]